jgi:hypothetical protein
LWPRRIPGIDPQTLCRHEEPAGGYAGARLAHADCRQYGAIGRDVVLHEPFECFGDPMDRVRRLESEALGEFPICRRPPRLGLLHECPTERPLQYVIATGHQFTGGLWRVPEEGAARRPDDFAGEHT